MPRYENNSISNSQLSVLKRSPQEFYQRFILGNWPEEDPADSMKLGSLLHCMALEPSEVDNRFAVAPTVDGKTKEGKAAKEAFAAMSNGKTIISSQLLERASMAIAGLSRHAEAAKMLAARSQADAMLEQAVYGNWHGVAIAGTPDMVLMNSQVIYDIKTTQDASPSGFAKSVAAFGYHRQAAMYTELLEQAIGCQFRFIFCVVETLPPFEAAVYELDYAAVMQGRSEVVSLLQEYQRRMQSQDWIAAWGKGVVSLALPRWYRDEMYQLEEVA